MSVQERLALNEAQSMIYSRSNIRRAFPDFDDCDVASIHLQNENCIVTYNDGTSTNFSKAAIKKAFQNFTYRLKDFFAYLGPNYRGPSVWHDNAYILFKGWTYSHALGHLSSNAQLQHRWADKFIHLSDASKVTTLLQSDQTDLGYLIAPDGFRLPDKPIDLDRDLDDEDEQQPMYGEPCCSCGSFKRQLNNLSDFQKEIEGFKPSCIHLTWFAKYRELLSKRTEVRNNSPSGTPAKCVAWWYAPPSDHLSNGRFILLHTKSGAQAPLSHWRTYKPNEVLTQNDAWDLFFNMMEAGYTPFPGTSLPQLKNAFKK
jgi:hypothetical protein|tara:strand:- start:3787 stop:4728 length:942 start_codon:yes stop_codon:yes gene_type:complete